MVATVLLDLFNLTFVYRDFDALDKDNALENVRIAFDIASRLGVPRVLDASEVAASSASKLPPDSLSMITYLHQLRTVLSLGATPEQHNQHPPKTPPVSSSPHTPHPDPRKEGEEKGDDRFVFQTRCDYYTCVLPAL